jgi:hypothetical protein
MKRTVLFVVAILSMAAAALSAGLTIKVVVDPAQLPQNLSGIVQKGDFLVSDGSYTAVVATSPRPAFSTINYRHPDVSGYLLAFVPEGGSKRIATQIGLPSVRVDGRALTVGEASVQKDGSGILVRTSAEGEGGLKLEIRIRYSFAFESGRINLVAEIRNAGPSEVTGLSFGLGANAQQNFNFSPFNARSFRKLNFRVWQRPDHALGWFNPNPLETRNNPLPGRLRPGQVHRVSYSVIVGSDPLTVLDRLYALAGVRPERVAFEFPNFEGLTEIMVREAATGAVFFRAFMDKPAPLAIPLPDGTYTIRAHFFPAVVEMNFAVGPSEKPLALQAPEFGRIRVSITDRSGRPALGKVSFIGLAPSPSPYFRPENPVETGRGWEGFKNSVYPFREGIDVVLPAGTYLATSSRGPEYTRDERVIEVFSGENPGLEFRLEKAVSTRGLISIDTHMHTQNSDGAMLIQDRLRSVIAEGLDVAVSADHNFITDYQPDL